VAARAARTHDYAGDRGAGAGITASAGSRFGVGTRAKAVPTGTHAHGAQTQLGEELSLRAGTRDGTPVIETRAAEIH